MKTLSMIAVILALGTMFAPALSQAMSEAGDRKEQADRELVQYYKDYNKGYYDNLENEADLDDDVAYQAINGKAYKMVDGLASDEWVPLTTDGYAGDYDQSVKAKEIKAANESLKRIKG